MYSFGLIWWIIPVRNASIMTFEADMGTSAFVRVIEQCCFNCVSKFFNAQAVNFISKPPKVMESRTYVKKPIWNTIETTLLYYSDNSTSPQVCRLNVEIRLRRVWDLNPQRLGIIQKINWRAFFQVLGQTLPLSLCQVIQRFSFSTNHQLVYDSFSNK